MEKLSYYYEKVKPHIHRRNIELATVLFILVCGLFVLLSGLPNEAVLTLKDGAIKYDGQVVRQKMSGQGTMTFDNGDIYEGEFANGTFNGQGKFTSSSGWYYEGNFLNGLAHGKGKLTTEKNVIYEGDFKKGVYQDEN